MAEMTVSEARAALPEILNRVAEGAPLKGCLTVAGPQVHEVRDLARTWREVTGHRALQIPMPVPGTVGRALRSGALTVQRPDARGTTGFADWLRSVPG